MNRFSVEDITRILNRAEIETSSLPSGLRRNPKVIRRYRPKTFCPYCGSGDTWAVCIDQQKVNPKYELYCQACDSFFGQMEETEVRNKQKQNERIRAKMKQMDVHELEERESLDLYDEAISNLFRRNESGVTAYEIKKYFNLGAMEQDRDIVFFDQEDAFRYLMILISLQDIDSYFSVKEGA